MSVPVFFAEELRQYLPSFYYDFLTAEDRQLFLADRFQFFSNRTKKNQVRVYNPSPNQYWLINASIIEIVSADSSFLVETLLEYCGSRNHKINLLIHPVYYVLRDPQGQLQEMHLEPREDLQAESYIYLQINRLSESELQHIQSDLEENYEQLDAVTGDFQAMLSALEHQPDLTPAEKSWFASNFVFLGYHNQESLGLFRNVHFLAASETYFQMHASQPHQRFHETSLRTRTNPDRQLLLLTLTEKGRTAYFIGHFAHRAHSQNLNEIPPLANLLAELYKGHMATPSSYMRKRLLRLLRTLPIALLFTRSTEFFLSLTRFALSNNFSEDCDSMVLADLDCNTIWLVTVVPARDAPEVPAPSLERFLQEQQWKTQYEVRVEFDRNELIMFGYQTAGQPLPEAQALLEFHKDEAFLTWGARLRKLIANRFSGEELIQEKRNLYFRCMSDNFAIGMLPEEALRDLELMETMADTRSTRVKVRYYNRNQNEDCIKIYNTSPWLISDLVPVLSYFSFPIQREQTFTFENGTVVYLNAFTVPAESRSKEDRARIAGCIELILNGESDSSTLDALALTAALQPSELLLLKSLNAYYWQTDKSLTYMSLAAFCVAYPEFIRALLDLFHSRLSSSPPAPESEARKKLQDSYTLFASVVDEQVGMHFVQIVSAIVRTNYYNAPLDIAYKVKSSLIDRMPEPVPYFEIFVFSNFVEGVHLRGGKVARGGLRWSDRPDYRTEVLALMKAQMVKNTVIVPEGSKGGFLLKKAPADKSEYRAAGVTAYKRYIDALLQLTDSRRGMDIIPPAGIQCLDEPDPYLVVAADKGTATFSDIANSISEGREFWLGDAFASGGQFGYDHKVQGITARGAWESVRRHARELALNPEADPMTVIGIGDMSGDVFGNGLLLSRSIQLIAAFNHLYIFLDPDPDPQASFAERERLFRDVLNWSDYNKDLISPGGGLYSRQSRSIEISARMQERLGITSASLSGEDLIKAILRAPIDLFWNGGIGTYVKATTETHYQAGDATNDRVRINGNELRCRMIAEGGNLGFTQAGRMEAASVGVRLNTDAIDNSAGVDMSDHEVNLKILLLGLEQQGRIDRTERNRIIRELDAAMIDLVLAHNQGNNLALSLEELRSDRRFTSYRHWIKELSKVGVLVREADAIPFESDLDAIEKTTHRLARPLLASLLGFTKLYISRKMLASENAFDFPDLLRSYFPDSLQSSFPDAITSHPLKREIIITEMVNLVVNRMGISAFSRLALASSADFARIAEICTQLLSLVHSSAQKLLPETLPCEIEYEFAYALEESLHYVALKLLTQPNYNTVLSSTSNEKLAAYFRSYPENPLPSGSIQALCQKHQLDPELSQRVQQAFYIANTLEDLFDFLAAAGQERTLTDYLSISNQMDLPGLRALVREKAAFLPQEQTFARRLETLLSKTALLLSSPGYGARSLGLEQLQEISLLRSQGQLTLPAMFEILVRIQPA